MTKNNEIHKNQLFDITRHLNGTLNFIYFESCLKKIKGASATRVKPSAAKYTVSSKFHTK